MQAEWLDRRQVSRTTLLRAYRAAVLKSEDASFSAIPAQNTRNRGMAADKVAAVPLAS
jgi:hypothetical protein